MVIQGFRPRVGGAELQLERLLPHLSALGVSATVLTRAVAGAPAREDVPGGEVRRTRLAGESRLASAWYVLAGAAHLFRHRGAVDVVHSHGALSEGAIALFGTYLGLPALVKILRTGEAGDFELLAARPGGRLRARMLARRAWFVAVTPETRAELLARGVPPQRIVDVPNGVDCGTFRPPSRRERAELRRELALGDAPTGVFVGRLIDVKRVDLLLRALPDVPGMILVVVGEGPERPALEELAAALKISGRVRFAGASGRVSDYLRAADLFLLPSRSEGLSNALLEAMASGLACLASPVSGVRDLFGEDRGLVVHEAEPSAWAAAMRGLAGSSTTRAEMGARAARWVRENASLDRTAERIVSAYGRVLRERDESASSRRS